MTIDEFCAKHPTLFHMAAADSLTSIRKHGLLSTAAILDLVGVTEKDRETLTRRRRPEMHTLKHAVHGSFVLRDQKPSNDNKLARCLTDMSVPDWYETLNSRVFLWATVKRVEGLLRARACRNQDQLVLTITTRPFVENYFSEVSVSSINSGSTLFTPPKKGSGTFVPLCNYPTAKGTKAIAEVTVKGGIPNIVDYIESYEVRRGT